LSKPKKVPAFKCALHWMPATAADPAVAEIEKLRKGLKSRMSSPLPGTTVEKIQE